MGNRIYSVMLGMINQHQFWIKHQGQDESSETNSSEKEGQIKNLKVRSYSSGAVYGLGLIGASIYYLRQGKTFQQKLLGFFKALVWPVYLVKRAFEFLEKE
jgi:hypothetical protein